MNKFLALLLLTALAVATAVVAGRPRRAAVALAGGALLANIISKVIVVGDTLMSRR